MKNCHLIKEIDLIEHEISKPMIDMNLRRFEDYKAA